MALDAHLEELSEKHRALDRKIEEEEARPTADPLKIAEWKRQKLRLKDEMERAQARDEPLGSSAAGEVILSKAVGAQGFGCALPAAFHFGFGRNSAPAAR